MSQASETWPLPPEAREWLHSLEGRHPLGLVLGSGFSVLEQALVPEVTLSFDGLPGFPQASVPGHAGRFLLGHIQDHPVVLQSGRLHYYEGHSMEEIARPVHFQADLGVKRILFTNAAGGIRSDLGPGSLMILSDHMNFMGIHPLRGARGHDGPPFLDLSKTYDEEGILRLEEAASLAKVPVTRGVYLAVCGPCYETPAEIRAFRALGADAVGMSTVPEAIIARWRGLQVSALSCITNHAAGLGTVDRLDHTDVLHQAQQTGAKATRLLEAWVDLEVTP